MIRTTSAFYYCCPATGLAIDFMVLVQLPIYRRYELLGCKINDRCYRQAYEEALIQLGENTKWSIIEAGLGPTSRLCTHCSILFDKFTGSQIYNNYSPFFNLTWDQQRAMVRA